MSARLLASSVLLICLAPVGAHAERAIALRTCDEALAIATRGALELELGHGPDVEDIVVRIEAPCGSPARVTLTDPRTELTFERDVSLADLPRSLHARMLALVAGELERLAERARASRLAEPLPSMLDVASAPPPDEVTEPEARDSNEPQRNEVDAAPAPRGTRRRSSLETLGIVRLYPGNRLTLGGARMGFTHARLSVGVSALGARRTVVDGELGVLVTSLDLGARIFPAPRASSVFAVYVRGDVGLARVEGSPASRGSAIGLVSYSPVVASVLEARVQLSAREAAVGFRLALAAGYTTGPRIRDISGNRLARLDGPILAASMGLSF